MATLLKGDCLEIMKGFPAKSVDCFICDLPYGQLTNADKGIGRDETNGAFAGGCPWDIKIDLVEFWKQIKRLCKDEHTPVLMFCNTKFGNELINSNPKWFRYDLVWDKGRGISFLSANKMPMKSHEMIYVFSKAGAYYKRIEEPSEKKAWRNSGVRRGNVYAEEMPRVTEQGEDNKRCSLSVLQIDKKSSYQLKGSHPTEKPKELYKWLIERYCPKDGLVLDPTAGSFNSIIVARELGLKAIGIEKDDKFFWTAVNKIK